MKVIFFKNDSGGDMYPVFKYDGYLTDLEILRIVCDSVGDDYDPDTEELFGDWYLFNLNDVELIKTD